VRRDRRGGGIKSVFKAFGRQLSVGLRQNYRELESERPEVDNPVRLEGTEKFSRAYQLIRRLCFQVPG
jgi:hypothetical protein